MSSTRLTRRRLGMVAALSSAAASAQAVAAQQPAVTTGPDAELESARENQRRSGVALRKFKVPQLLEPSFSFRA